jgi:single-strand DNA-binding protein
LLFIRAIPSGDFALLSLSHPLGAFPAPCGTARLCFSGSFPKKSPAQTTHGFGPGAGRDFLLLLPKKRRLPLGAGHPRVALRMGVPSEIRANLNPEDNKMALYENTVNLKGFLGKDAKTETTRNDSAFTVLSLATKSSYKDKQNDAWISRTEWHRVICFGNIAENARNLKKGDYVEVQGELRSSDYETPSGDGQPTVKRRSWDVRASVVRKLARTEKHDAEPVPEEGAA